MKRYCVHDLLCIAVDDGHRAREPFLKWLAELSPDPNPVRTPADITWYAESPVAPESGGGQPETVRDAAGRWYCSGSGHNMVAILQHALLERDASFAHACGLVVGGMGVLENGRPYGEHRTLDVLNHRGGLDESDQVSRLLAVTEHEGRFSRLEAQLVDMVATQFTTLGQHPLHGLEAR